MGLAGWRRQGRSENPEHPESGQSDFARPESHLRQRRLGTRLLSEIQQPPSRVPASVVERSELGRNQQALPVIDKEVASGDKWRDGRPRPSQPSAARQSPARTAYVRAASASSPLKELPDLRPILPNNQVGAQMPAPPQQLQSHSRYLGKLPDRLIRNIRIVLRMKHHDLRRSNFRRMISGVVEFPPAQLLPIAVRQAVPIPKRRTNISGVAGVRSLSLLRSRKNPPIHHRTIRNRSLNPGIKRTKNSRCPAKAPANHKHFIQRNAKPPPKRQLPKLLRQSADHIQNVQMRRSFQEFPAALPSPAIPRIEHPISLTAKKFGHPLFARNRRHPIAKNNGPLRLTAPGRRQELRDDVTCKSRPEHNLRVP